MSVSKSVSVLGLDVIAWIMQVEAALGVLEALGVGNSSAASKADVTHLNADIGFALYEKLLGFSNNKRLFLEVLDSC